MQVRNSVRALLLVIVGWSVVVCCCASASSGSPIVVGADETNSVATSLQLQKLTDQVSNLQNLILGYLKVVGIQARMMPSSSSSSFDSVAENSTIAAAGTGDNMERGMVFLETSEEAASTLHLNSEVSDALSRADEALERVSNKHEAFRNTEEATSTLSASRQQLQGVVRQIRQAFLAQDKQFEQALKAREAAIDKEREDYAKNLHGEGRDLDKFHAKLQHANEKIAEMRAKLMREKEALAQQFMEEQQQEQGHEADREKLIQESNLHMQQTMLGYRVLLARQVSRLHQMEVQAVNKHRQWMMQHQQSLMKMKVQKHMDLIRGVMIRRMQAQRAAMAGKLARQQMRTVHKRWQFFLTHAAKIHREHIKKVQARHKSMIQRWKKALAVARAREHRQAVRLLKKQAAEKRRYHAIRVKIVRRKQAARRRKLAVVDRARQQKRLARLQERADVVLQNIRKRATELTRQREKILARHRQFISKQRKSPVAALHRLEVQNNAASALRQRERRQAATNSRAFLRELKKERLQALNDHRRVRKEHQDNLHQLLTQHSLQIKALRRQFHNMKMRNHQRLASSRARINSANARRLRRWDDRRRVVSARQLRRHTLLARKLKNKESRAEARHRQRLEKLRRMHLKSIRNANVFHKRYLATLRDQRSQAVSWNKKVMKRLARDRSLLTAKFRTWLDEERKRTQSVVQHLARLRLVAFDYHKKYMGAVKRFRKHERSYTDQVVNRAQQQYNAASQRYHRFLRRVHSYKTRVRVQFDRWVARKNALKKQQDNQLRQARAQHEARLGLLLRNRVRQQARYQRQLDKLSESQSRQYMHELRRHAEFMTAIRAQTGQSLQRYALSLRKAYFRSRRAMRKQAATYQSNLRRLRRQRERQYRQKVRQFESQLNSLTDRQRAQARAHLRAWTLEQRSAEQRAAARLRAQQRDIQNKTKAYEWKLSAIRSRLWKRYRQRLGSYRQKWRGMRQAVKAHRVTLRRLNKRYETLLNSLADKSASAYWAHYRKYHTHLARLARQYDRQRYAFTVTMRNLKKEQATAYYQRLQKYRNHIDQMTRNARQRWAAYQGKLKHQARLYSAMFRKYTRAWNQKLARVARQHHWQYSRFLRLTRMFRSQKFKSHWRQVHQLMAYRRLLSLRQVAASKRMHRSLARLGHRRARSWGKLKHRALDLAAERRQARLDQNRARLHMSRNQMSRYYASRRQWQQKTAHQIHAYWAKYYLWSRRYQATIQHRRQILLDAIRDYRQHMAIMHKRHASQEGGVWRQYFELLRHRQRQLFALQRRARATLLRKKAELHRKILKFRRVRESRWSTHHQKIEKFLRSSHRRFRRALKHHRNLLRRQVSTQRKIYSSRVRFHRQRMRRLIKGRASKLRSHLHRVHRKMFRLARVHSKQYFRTAHALAARLRVQNHVLHKRYWRAYSKYKRQLSLLKLKWQRILTHHQIRFSKLYANASQKQQKRYVQQYKVWSRRVRAAYLLRYNKLRRLVSLYRSRLSVVHGTHTVKYLQTVNRHHRNLNLLNEQHHAQYMGLVKHFTKQVADATSRHHAAYRTWKNHYRQQRNLIRQSASVARRAHFHQYHTMKSELQNQATLHHNEYHQKAQEVNNLIQKLQAEREQFAQAYPVA